MDPLPPEYLVEFYRQTAFMAAVLGGFAAAFAGALLPSDLDKRVGTWAVGAATTASVLLVVTTLGASVVVLDAVRLGLTDFDLGTWPRDTVRTKLIADLAFFGGIYTLIAALGLSGWTRSRRAGWATTAAGGLGLVLVTTIIAGTFS